MNKDILEYFIYVEYLCYFIAITIFLITTILSIKPIYLFFRNPNDHKTILKTRLLFGYIFTYCLSLILIGHIIKLIYTGSFYVAGLVGIIIILQEGLTWILDQETKELHKRLREKI